MIKPSGSRSHQWYVACAVLVAVLAVLLILFSKPFRSWVVHSYYFISDRDKIQAFISSTGEKGPLVFILFQILQVILAPVPGEASGFIGGYLFGVSKGFFFSTIGLTIGSMINFGIGRGLGVRYVRRWIKAERFEKYDRLLKKKGVLVVFILFLFPGFPKDWLCLFLGVSSLSFKLLIILSTIGRMPGTLMLSFQGAMLFDKNYGLLSALFIFCAFMSYLVYRYRDRLNRWIEKLNGTSL